MDPAVDALSRQVNALAETVDKLLKLCEVLRESQLTTMGVVEKLIDEVMREVPRA